MQTGMEETNELPPVELETGEGQNTPPPADGDPAAAAAPPAYTPNYKYKVLKEEKEIPEWARPVVTNAEMEKQVREIFEKADGIEPVKAHRDQLLQQTETFQKEWVPFITEATAAIDCAKKGDLDSFFEKVGIPEKQILEYALHRLNLREDPAKLSAHEETRKIQLRNADLERQVQESNAGYQNLAARQMEFELSSHLSRPEIRDTVQAFEAHQGAGAFRAEVVRRGQYYASLGKDLPVEQVVEEVTKLIGWQGQQSTPPALQTPPAEPGTRQIPTSLPNIQGTGTSPAKRVPRSLEEMRALAKTLR